MCVCVFTHFHCVERLSSSVPCLLWDSPGSAAPCDPSCNTFYRQLSVCVLINIWFGLSFCLSELHKLSL